MNTFKWIYILHKAKMHSFSMQLFSYFSLFYFWSYKHLNPSWWNIATLFLLTVSQRQYIVDLLKCFGMSDCKPISTPMVPGLHLSKTMNLATPLEREEMEKIPYLSAIGALNYLAICTCPDISYTVGCLAHYSENPGLTHWMAVKHIMQYLKGTMDLKLTYTQEKVNYIQFWDIPGIVVGNLKYSVNFRKLEICMKF